MGKKVVLKIESNDILHKSEIGGVRVGIQGEQEIKNAFQGIMERAEQERPDAKINGILVQEMLEEGLEMIIGVTCDPNLGPMILLGMGGIFTEIFQDAVLYPAPHKSLGSRRDDKFPEEQQAACGIPGTVAS